MKQHLLHTPEGVRDIYNGECEKKLYLEDKLYGILKTYGCRPIQTRFNPGICISFLTGKAIRLCCARILRRPSHGLYQIIIWKKPCRCGFATRAIPLSIRTAIRGGLRKIPSLAQNLSGIILPMPMQKSCPWLPNACWEPD